MHLLGLIWYLFSVLKRIQLSSYTEGSFHCVVFLSKDTLSAA